MTMNALRLPLLLLSLSLSLLAGCSTVGGWFGFGGPPKAELDTLKIVALDDANDHQATEVDLVFTYQEDIAATLPQDAPAWFEQRDKILARYAGDIDVVSLEIPAGFVIEEVKLPKRHGKALQVLVYANYVPATGQAVLTLTKLEDVQLTLKKASVAFAPIE